MASSSGGALRWARAGPAWARLLWSGPAAAEEWGLGDGHCGALLAGDRLSLPTSKLCHCMQGEAQRTGTAGAVRHRGLCAPPRVLPDRWTCKGQAVCDPDATPLPAWSRHPDGDTLGRPGSLPLHKAQSRGNTREGCAGPLGHTLATTAPGLSSHVLRSGAMAPGGLFRPSTLPVTALPRGSGAQHPPCQSPRCIPQAPLAPHKVPPAGSHAHRHR